MEVLKGEQEKKLIIVRGLLAKQGGEQWEGAPVGMPGNGVGVRIRILSPVPRPASPVPGHSDLCQKFC